ncbi:hypothetical protein GBAR_LOCUS16979 [Geodia barretti]|uniref:Band 7 domain-containing protein n=1 Tax=Geodia barretti TaxID=519541 RepID=A0AA35SGZ3_GEOBA|nr:hypothetical protein GBAR_LOCUS16979 [Geodia barretti]
MGSCDDSLSLWSRPKELFHNRLEIESVRVRDSIKLDANHLLVVYKQEEGHIERRVVEGPTVFIPSAHEWLHEFTWHGSHPNDPSRFTPKGNIFQQLCRVPSQFYYNVRDVRTKNDTLITVKLMLFYELVDVNTMLNLTHDPIADMINAVSSDIVSLASQRTYEVFLQDTAYLGALESYPQLTSRAERIGYRISKVVYRGYQAPQRLQATHDEAIQSRVHLKLMSESEEQTQALEEFKLRREKERIKLKHEMEQKLQDHTQEMQKLTQDWVLEEERLVYQSALKLEAEELEAKLEVEKKEHQLKAAHLESLRELGVDMTRYLVARQPQFGPEKEVIVGAPTSTIPSNHSSTI